MSKPRISAKSVEILRQIDRYVRQCNMRGGMLRFHGAAADVCDGLFTRAELDDLIRRRFLDMVHYTRSEAGLPEEWAEKAIWSGSICGRLWSVNPTERMIRTFWPDRLVSEPTISTT